MAANHGEEYTSKSLNQSMMGPEVGLSFRYWVTSAALVDRCGNNDPGTAATASINSRNKAVRMLVSCRQAQRSIPRNPSCGSTTSPPAAFGPLPLGSFTTVSFIRLAISLHWQTKTAVR